jgi:hypothetical protein
VSHVGSLVKLLGDSQIPNLDLVLLSQKHVDCLDVPVQNLVRVQIIQTDAHLDEKLPNLGLIQGSSHLSFEILAQISILAILHDDDDIVAIEV